MADADELPGPDVSSSERARTRPPDLFEPSGSTLYHFTRFDNALEKILKSRTLKMSPLSHMQDPRESQPWMPTVGGYGAPDDDLRNDLGDIDRYAALMKDMNPGYGDGLRDRIKVLAFSLDDPRIEDDATRTIYDWGFARPRLWEHYGDRHRGVCLCFDREGFTAYIRERLADEGTLLDDALVYRNEEISPRSLFFLAEDVRAEDRPSDAQIHRHREDFLFTKLCDWATEFEYRFALGTDHVRPVWVPYGNTLKAVVLGYATDNVYQPSLDLLCDASHAETFRLSWVNGFPRLAPAT